ncbi:MAG: terminase family protein [Nitrospirota bacterium]|nr:terminase family protein [Nitrospirota bacterium]
MRVALHPKQALAFGSPATELLYGGAAGGGKSFLLRVSAIRWCLAVPGCQVFLFRRSLPELKSNHLRGPGSLLELLGPLTAARRVSLVQQSGEFRFWNGSTLRLCHLQHDGDLSKYQGAEIHVLLMDELTHFSSHQYRFLRARVRLGGLQVAAALAHRLPRIECASNPGSVGHQWVKAAFVTPAEPLKIWRTPKPEGGMRRQYIPARARDNPTLLERDPEYLDRLSGLGTAELVRALRDGDWDVVAGQAFEMWRADRHVIEPFAVPPRWTRFRALDWGSSKPFSVGWWAVSDGAVDGILAGALVRYREWYGWDGKPDHGLRLTSEQVARGIREREADDERIAYSVADPAVFGRHDGPTVAERMAEHGVILRRATNDRKAGFQEMRSRLTGLDGRPMLLAFSTCRNGFLRTVPDLVLCPHDPEDVDTTQEDHAYDEARYACMSRPWTSSAGRGARGDRWERLFGDQPHPGWRLS